MSTRLEEILTHDDTEDCIACRARDFAAEVLVPAAAAWEASADLPRFALALHGAAAMLGAMLAEGLPRDEIEEALSRLLDEIASQVAEQGALAGPAQGSA